MHARRASTPHFAFFLTVYLLFSAAGCNQVTRLLDLDPNADRLPLRAMASPTKPVASQSRCCWCVSKDTNQNSTQAYVNRQMCEDRTGLGGFARCQQITVTGDTCSLVKVSPQAGKLNCKPNPLHYEEGGQTKTLAPPDDYELTCRARVLVRAQQSRNDQLSVNPDTPGVEDDSYCSCEHDIDTLANCRVVKYTRGVPQVLASSARREDQPLCTRDVCNALFSQETFRATCPRYIDGEP